MSIRTQDLFEQKASAFGAATNSQRFTSDFITAVNRALADIQLLALISTSSIEDIETDIDLDAKYETVLSVGVDYHLLAIGQQSAMDKQATYAMFRDMIKTAQATDMEDRQTAETLEVKLGDLSD
jgi:hypothetical protein